MTKKWKILTVGDGDLTFSLALARAYGNHVELTASVLDLNQEKLLLCFPDAPLLELERLQIPILFGVDATQLHQQPNKWDVILFHHPHLGLASLDQDEAAHAARHYQLLCHYLYSASQVAKLVHVCLCGTQRETWRLDEAAQRQGLQLLRTIATAVPIAQVWDADIEPVEASLDHAAPRRYRNGKLGSRHFLGRYGYRHRRTAGEQYHGGSSDMNVAGSMHYVFSSTLTETSHGRADETTTNSEGNDMTCSVCGARFASRDELSHHMKAPAMPQVAELRNVGSVSTTTAPDERDETSLPSHNSANVGKNGPDLLVSRPTFAMVGEKEHVLIVDSHCDGKRLRWFLQQHMPTSKKQAEMAIQNGRILIEGTPALDSSRILKTGMKIVVLKSAGEASSSHPPTNTSNNGDASVLDIVYRREPFLVVDKPSGMRTKGAFAGTVEFTISQQEGTVYESLSKLDTSCSGLCVLMAQNHSNNHQSPPIQHSLLALVHGRVPDTWFPKHQMTVTMQRKWQPKKRKHPAGEQHQQQNMSNVTPQEPTMITIIPLERSIAVDGTPSSSLSTVCIQTEYPSAASICYWMRQQGYPVVGDMNCRREYLELKRSIRNRIKNKLCLVCHEVQWQQQQDELMIQVPAKQDADIIPEKLSAQYWETNFGGTSADDDSNPGPSQKEQL